MTTLYRIKLENGSYYYATTDENLVIEKGNHVIIRKDFFLDHGIVLAITDGDINTIFDSRKSTEPPKIIRLATEADLDKIEENRNRSQGALNTAKQHILHLNLPMRILNVMYSIDCKLVTIQFTAEGRVDFRELIKSLASALNTRIELRQIGVRDETAIIGGFGICGQPVCCARFLNDFASINVKMAKDQDLSLNPVNISGICGRLKCCLKYEQEAYLELQKGMPHKGDLCECTEGSGRVFDRNLISGRVSLNIDIGGGHCKPCHCHRSEIKICEKSRNTENYSKEEKQLKSLED